MKRKWVVCVPVAVVLLGSIILGVLAFREDQTPFSFPMWEQAVEESDVNQKVKIQFLGVDFAALTTALDETATAEFDRILIRVSPEERITYGAGYHLDYLHNETWYTVFSAPAQDTSLIELSESKKLDFIVNSGFLDECTGFYRLYIDKLGYCEFEML